MEEADLKISSGCERIFQFCLPIMNFKKNRQFLIIKNACSKTKLESRLSDDAFGFLMNDRDFDFPQVIYSYTFFCSNKCPTKSIWQHQLF